MYRLIDGLIIDIVQK